MSLQNTLANVSLVIPNYNGKGLLEKHLSSVIDAAGNAEVIVVDDASIDDSVEFLANKFPSVKVVIHKTNKRFAASCNTGVDVARGDIVVLLNNDVSPDSNFLKPLLKHFDDAKVFAVGCGETKSVNSNKLSGKSCGKFERGLIIHWRCEEQTKGNNLWAAGGSGAFRKSVWHELDGMDTLFAPAYEEDRDICYRALKGGYKVLFEPKSVVIHKHETTNIESLGSKEMLKSSYKNQFLIVWKNITGKKMLLFHVLWLPYHLIAGTIRSNGMLLAGFIWAFSLLPKLYYKRKIELQNRKISDEQILALQ